MPTSKCGVNPGGTAGSSPLLRHIADGARNAGFAASAGARMIVPRPIGVRLTNPTSSLAGRTRRRQLRAAIILLRGAHSVASIAQVIRSASSAELHSELAVLRRWFYTWRIARQLSSEAGCPTHNLIEGGDPSWVQFLLAPLRMIREGTGSLFLQRDEAAQLRRPLNTQLAD